MYKCFLGSYSKISENRESAVGVITLIDQFIKCVQSVTLVYELRQLVSKNKNPVFKVSN